MPGGESSFTAFSFFLQGFAISAYLLPCDRSELYREGMCHTVSACKVKPDGSRKNLHLQLC